MMVREWFRLARAAAWDAQWVDCAVIFRAPDYTRWGGPYTPAIPLYTFVDLYNFLTAVCAGAPDVLESVDMRVRRQVTEATRRMILG